MHGNLKKETILGHKNDVALSAIKLRAGTQFTLICFLLTYNKFTNTK